MLRAPFALPEACWARRSGFSALTKKIAKPRNRILGTLVNAVVSIEVLVIFSLLTICVLVSGHLVWLLERHSNPVQFPTNYLDGVDDGMWWSVVTMV